jgi:hypothetical protein
MKFQHIALSSDILGIILVTCCLFIFDIMILITPLVCSNSSQGSIHRAAQLVHMWRIGVTKFMILKHWLWNATGYVSIGWNTLHVKDLYCIFRKSRSSRLNCSSLYTAPKRSTINQSTLWYYLNLHFVK